MKTCDTCKFWTRKLVDNGKCTRIGLNPEENGQPATWINDKLDEACLMTLPTFGCTLHEEVKK